MKNVRSVSRRLLFGCLISGVALFGLAGCGSGPRSDQPGPATHQHGDHGHDHDHGHASPEGFAAGIATLRGHFETIRDALAENDVNTAHGPIHHVVHLLEQLPERARHANLGAEDLTTAQAAITAMSEAYAKIDKAIHGDGDVDYDAVRDQLDQGMAELDAVVERAKAAP
jgi:uncharacterized protein YukE